MCLNVDTTNKVLILKKALNQNSLIKENNKVKIIIYNKKTIYIIKSIENFQTLVKK